MPGTRQSSKPVLLAGDFNATPESDFIEEIESYFTVLSPKDKHTYPARSPKKCIDYIASYNGSGEALVCADAKVLPHGEVSDHLPVMVSFRVKTPTERILYGKPYLQNPTTDAVSVIFQTRTIAHAWVEYGEDTLNLRRARMEYGGQTICHDIEHKVRLEGLKPGGSYFYRVCAQEILYYGAYKKIMGNTQTTEFYSFRLPEKKQTDFTALIFNDLHREAETIRLSLDLPKAYRMTLSCSMVTVSPTQPPEMMPCTCCTVSPPLSIPNRHRPSLSVATMRYAVSILPHYLPC